MINSTSRPWLIPITPNDSDEFHSQTFAQIHFQTKQQQSEMCVFLCECFLIWVIVREPES